MKAYVGQCRGHRMMSACDAHGLGEATQRGEFPPRRMSHGWFFDNGAFADWQKGRVFNERVWGADLERIASEGPTPDFVVLPDRVADAESLAFSISWVPRARDVAPMALVVQDGMDDADVARAVERHGIAVLFVGGSLAWKLQTGAAWVRLAHRLGVRCHIGRVGTAPRVRWARECGADSVDSCTPLWSMSNFLAFVNALSDPYQSGLFGPVPPPPREPWRKPCVSV